MVIHCYLKYLILFTERRGNTRTLLVNDKQCCKFNMIIFSPDFEHDVLVWDESLPAADRAPPPVVGHLPVQQDRLALPEVDLPRRPRLEVVQSVSLQHLGLCRGRIMYRVRQ